MCVSACQWVVPDPLTPLLPHSSSPLLSFNPQSLLLFFIYLSLIPTVQQPSHIIEYPPPNPCSLSLDFFFFNFGATWGAWPELDTFQEMEKRRQEQPQVVVRSCKDVNDGLVFKKRVYYLCYTCCPVLKCSHWDNIWLDFSIRASISCATVFPFSVKECCFRTFLVQWWAVRCDPRIIGHHCRPRVLLAMVLPPLPFWYH